MIPSNTYILWISAFFFILAGAFLFYRIKKENLFLLYPIDAYLTSIGLSFFFLSIYNLTSLKLLLFISSFFVMFGGAYISRLPLKLINYRNEKKIFYSLLVIAIIISLYMYYANNAALHMRIAHIYTFILAGLFTIGYIIYSGIKSKNKAAKIKSLGTGTTLSLCCFVAHGLIAFNMIPLIALPFAGLITVDLPLIFASLSAITFIIVLFVSRFYKT